MWHQENFERFAKHLTGFKPYRYQVAVAEALTEGKNVILSVPTGAGKTWASLLPFLWLKTQSNSHFPTQTIYSLPLRALCNSIYLDVQEALTKQQHYPILRELATRQTGEFKDDEFLEKDLIFSTIDQSLSSFLCFPLSLSQRQANLNAGALIGRYLIFDEFHLLDTERAMTTSLGMLKMLQSLSRFCIMTATLSKGFMLTLEQELPNTLIITLDDFQEDRSIIGSLQLPANETSKKHLVVADQLLCGTAIIKEHQKRSIVICNRVEKAQKIYLELEYWAKENDVVLLCLHARFFDQDRKQYEQHLKTYFGKHSDPSVSAILIATQVIEAGIDISCEVMHTEIAPINALLQRAGRCARYANELGKIFVYDLLEVSEQQELKLAAQSPPNKEEKKLLKQLKSRYLPYSASLCLKTLEQLKIPKYQQLTEAVMLQLVESILGVEEAKVCQQFRTSRFNHTAIHQAWESCSKSHYRTTIRNIQSLDVILVDRMPDGQKFWLALDSISLFRWSLVKWVKEVLETVSKGDLDEEIWVAGILEEDPVFSENMDWDDNSVPLIFRPLSLDELKESFGPIFLNTQFFQYDPAIGLNKQRGSSRSPFKVKSEKASLEYAYKKDTFVEHTQGLLAVFKQDFLPKLSFVFQAWNKVLDINLDWKRLIELMLILHDYGKLNTAWQTWMQRYQKALAALPNSIYTFEPNLPLGHTGFNQEADLEGWDQSLANTTEFELLQRHGKRPGHSGIGAYAALSAVEDFFEVDEEIVLAVSYAIARHHGVSNYTYPTFDVSDHNYTAIQELLNAYQFHIQLEQACAYKGELDALETSEFDTYLLYLFLVRILRLCDRQATKSLDDYITR